MDPEISLELKIMHCKDLRAFNFFQKLLVYVLVSIISEDDHELKVDKDRQRRTPTDPEGDGDPEWNHEMRFDLSEVSLQNRDRLFIHFDLRHEGLYFGDKVIGEVRVPLKDLVRETSGIVRFMSYQVRSPDGKPNGVLRFSCKVNGIDSPKPEISGYPVIDYQHQSPSPSPSPVVSETSATHGLYPSLELEANTHQSFSTPQVQTVQYPSVIPQCASSHEDHYPPPYAYYPPPPPPTQPIIGHGACCPPPHQTSQNPWTIGGYDYVAHGNWSVPSGQPHAFAYPHGYGAGRDTHPASWTGSGR